MTKDKKKVKIDKADSDEEYLKELVIARIEATSGNFRLMIGGREEITKEDLIKNVREGSQVGKEVIKAQLEFLKDMASGKIYANE